MLKDNRALTISICNDGNLACADYLPMIVWPRKSVLFCSTDHFHITNSRRGWWSWIEWVLIMRLTWHFYLTCQVRSWRSKWFMNVIDWSRKAAIRVKIWWIINTHALLSKLDVLHDLWQPSLYHMHIERPYNNHLQWDNTHLLLCVRHRVITYSCTVSSCEDIT